MQLLGGLFGGVAGLLATTLLKKKAPVQPMGTPTRDDAAAQVAKDDALRRRKGALADMTNGSQGYEAASSQVGRLVVGN